jgi:mannose-1-phosphate guanylyltransferase
VLDGLRANRRALAEAAERIAAAWSTPQRDEVLAREYAGLERISIDYAVMEKARDVLVLEAPFGWDDVGSWLALERMHPQDAQHNTVLANHAGMETQRCVIVGDSDRLIATAGVQDLLIIQDGNVTLIAHRSQESAIKKLVERLQAEKRDDYI